LQENSYRCLCPRTATPLSVTEAPQQSLQQHLPTRARGFNLTVPLRNRTAQADQGSLRDRVSPGRTAPRAALHADSHAGGQPRGLRSPMIAKLVKGPPRLAGLQPAKPGRRSEEAAAWGASLTAQRAATAAQPSHAENQLISAQATYAQPAPPLYQMLPPPCNTTASTCRRLLQECNGRAPSCPDSRPAKPAKSQSTAPPAAPVILQVVVYFRSKEKRPGQRRGLFH